MYLKYYIELTLLEYSFQMVLSNRTYKKEVMRSLQSQ